jgi:hypothetical protein
MPAWVAVWIGGLPKQIGQANHLEMMNKWFLFLGLPYVAVFCNLAAKTVKIRLGMCSTMPQAQVRWVTK